ncbi:DUF2065 domain-containing protein [Aliiroseovarius sp. F20344]|uniref:DUF2065 domain-containing protein n=1 Tax=Aliiroseovarius sp. F20344 TaxID=2926414 RepID=UPI001FF0E9A8|nr:DUF2065 domain-containing protein [Aliiroseovarius sp. F20344]MCK0142346.1 DUF2065 domain-containing protein [Aliiroseovarius sp. F20344]
MSTILFGIGLVLVIEGLVFALAPSRLDDLVAMMAAMSRDQRRLIGIAALALGVLAVWVSGVRL